MDNQPKLINVLLIDPYKKELRKAAIGADLPTWYQVLRCDCVDVQQLMTDEDANMDLWFDDEFLLKEPLGPFFEVFHDSGGNERRYGGYAFIACSDREGNTVSIGGAAMAAPTEILRRLLGLRFEPYERRLGQDAFLDLRIRTPELEMPGRFKFLDICPDCGKIHQ